MRALKKAAIPLESVSAGRAFSNHGPLGSSLLAYAAATAASIVMAFAPPAHAEQAGKCKAVLVDGPVREPFSFTSEGAKITELVVRFPDSSSPAKARHVELILQSPFDRERLQETLLGSMLAAGDALAVARTVSFDCVSRKSAASVPRPPGIGPALPAKTAPATLTKATAARVPAVPALPPADKTAKASTDATPSTVQPPVKTEPPVQVPSGPSLDELRSQAVERMAGIRSLVERAKSLGISGSHVRAAGKAYDALKGAAKRADSTKLQSAISGAEDADVPLKAAVREAEKTLRAGSLKLAEDVERISADSRLKKESRDAASASAARIKVESAREPLDVAAFRAAKRDASAMLPRFGAEIAAEQERLDRLAKQGMGSCEGTIPVSASTGKGPVEGYPFDLPMNIIVETSSWGGKQAKQYPVHFNVRLDVRSIRPESLESTITKVTSKIKAELEERCPEADSKSIHVGLQGIRPGLSKARTRMIDYLDSEIEGASGDGLKSLQKVRRYLAGSSKAEEEEAKQKAMDKAGRR